MRKIKLQKDIEITKELIIKLIDNHKKEKKRIERLKKYYRNENDILNRVYTDINKPTNKIAHNYAGYITDSYVGYFLGKPITYKSENTNLLEQIRDIFIYNDEHDNNTTIGQEQSICGYAYEILYTDENADIRFKCIPTEEMIVVYDNTIEENIMFGIRYYDIEDVLDETSNIQQVEIYTLDSIITYEKDGNELKEISIQDNNFNDIPIVDYENNINRIGDFEKVISLINAYDQANSDTANDFEYFTNALLVISGILMKDEEEEENQRPLDFKNNRVLNFLDGNCKAEYLIKDINDTALENYKNRLNKDIHKFSNVLDVTDENFASNISGIAMKYKLSGMENVTGIKESKYKKGLLRRIELIVNILNIKTNNTYLFTEINPVFTRNIPANETELVNMAKQLYGIVSDDTILSIIPFISDIELEKELLRQSKEDKAIEYENFNTNIENVEEGAVNGTN